MIEKKKGVPLSLKYLASNLLVVIGLVMVWRGVWYVWDTIDIWFLGGNQLLSGIIGIILGTAALYLPDHDLKEMQKL